MRIVPTPLSGLFQIEPDVFGDARGSSLRSFGESRYDAASIEKPFVQDNFSWSVRARCEGSTISWAVPRAKLVMVVKGSVYDVAVDIRQGRQPLGSGMGWNCRTRRCANSIFLPASHGFACSAKRPGSCTSVRMCIPRRMNRALSGMIRVGYRLAYHCATAFAKDQAYQCLADMTTELPRYIGR